jgi:hypothetical protein
MPETIHGAELLRRHAVITEQLCSVHYPLVLGMIVDNDEPPPPVSGSTMRLAQLGFVIGEEDRWNGSLTVEVTLQNLRLSRACVQSVIDYARPQFLEQWVEALLTSHIEDFEDLVTHIAPGAWHRGASAAGHPVVVSLGRQPSRLMFRLYARDIANLLSAQMQRLAEDVQAGGEGNGGGRVP